MVIISGLGGSILRPSARPTTSQTARPPRILATVGIDINGETLQTCGKIDYGPEHMFPVLDPVNLLYSA